MCLETAANKCGDRGDGDYGPAMVLERHLSGGRLAGVEGAVEVDADCGGEEVVVETRTSSYLFYSPGHSSFKGERILGGFVREEHTSKTPQTHKPPHY